MTQGKVKDAKGQSEASVEEGCQKLKKTVDDLEDQLLPPLDIIVPLVKNAIPGAGKIVMTLSNKVLNMPMSGLLHTFLIDLFPLYLFYYSSYSVLSAMAKGMAVTDVKKKCDAGEDYCPAGTKYAAEFKSSLCLKAAIEAELWNNNADRTDPVNCLLADKVDNPPPLPEAEANSTSVMAVFNMGAFAVCLMVWLAVLGLFFYYNNFAAKVRDGRYFKNSFLMRRTRLYRYLCGFLGLCIGASVAFIVAALAMTGEWEVLRDVFPAMVAAAITVKPILKPKKPKFDYSELHDVGLQRGSFFTTNASFASSFGDALMQARRGYHDKLKEMLENPDGCWEEILAKCAEQHESDSKVLVVGSQLAHKVPKIMGALDSLETKQPDTGKK